MNKNPEKPKQIDELMSSVFNPNYKEMKKDSEYWKVQKKIKKEIFGE